MPVAPDQVIRGHTTAKLVEALLGGHFVLYGQPIVPLQPEQERIQYLEVLVRYVEEEINCLPPGGFIETLEELNLMPLLDRWVVSRVVQFFSAAPGQQGQKVTCFSVNLSVDSLYDESFGVLLTEYGRKNQIPPGSLCFEIPEQDAHTHSNAITKMSSITGSMGLGITISSYSGEFIVPRVLPALGVDTVKIDGQLAGRVTRNVADSARVKAIQAMCSHLGIRTVAEMIEQGDVLEKLKTIGIQYAQGYAVAPPAVLRATEGGFVKASVFA